MAILFDWYETPKPTDKQKEEKSLHPRIMLNGSVGTDRLRNKIQIRSSLSETDVTAVLDALSHVMSEELADGRQVHLDGIGYFYPTLTCTETVVATTKRKSTKVKLKCIKFRADQTLKNGIGAIKVQHVKLNDHSCKLTNEEIDKRLDNYFKTHQFLRRSDFQRLCGMMKTTAMRHIRRLRDEGKLENLGSLMQPIYVLHTHKSTDM